MPHSGLRPARRRTTSAPAGGITVVIRCRNDTFRRSPAAVPDPRRLPVHPGQRARRGIEARCVGRPEPRQSERTLPRRAQPRQTGFTRNGRNPKARESPRRPYRGMPASAPDLITATPRTRAACVLRSRRPAGADPDGRRHGYRSARPRSIAVRAIASPASTKGILDSAPLPIRCYKWQQEPACSYLFLVARTSASCRPVVHARSCSKRSQPRLGRFNRLPVIVNWNRNCNGEQE